MECFAKIVKGHYYFRDISFSRFLLYDFNIINFLNTGLIFSLEVFILFKKVWGPSALRAVDFDIPFTITAFHWSKRTEQPFGSLAIGIKNFIKYIWIFVSCCNYFWKLFRNFWKHLKWSTFKEHLQTFLEVFHKTV